MYNFEIDEKDISYVKEHLEKHYFSNAKGNSTLKGYEFSKNYDTSKLKEKLVNLYHDHGLGYKLLVKYLKIDKCTYSCLRKIFLKLGIDSRKGTSIVTEKLKQIRSENVKGNKNPWYDWTNKKPEMQKKSKRYLGGWYFNQSKKKVRLS